MSKSIEANVGSVGQTVRVCIDIFLVISDAKADISWVGKE